jgi:phospholipid/cholesterol/gamma-HCH transport system ATP-binding protein
MSEPLAVEFAHVSKSFGDRKVLVDVSFQLGEGKALCILGRSGTGKTVTLKLLDGLLKPDSGNVCIESENISHANEKALSSIRRHIGFLFQGGALFDSFTVGENLAMPFRYLNRTKTVPEIQQAVDETLKRVGLERDVDKMPGELSGGMSKRAGLARALVLNPTLLLADEPTSGLDQITASEIDDLLIQVQKELHTTLVIVTHDVRSARRVADYIAVLDQGLLVGFGTISELEKSDNEMVQKLIAESHK